jgi:serine/threonine-protein kinase
MHAMIYEDMVPIRARRPDLPDDLEAIVERALKREPDERYPSCREMQADLERFVITQGEPLSAIHVAKLVSGLPAAEKESGAASRTPSRPNKPSVGFGTPAGQTPAGYKTPAKRASGEQQRLQVTPAAPAQEEDASAASTLHMTAEELEAQVAAAAAGGGAVRAAPPPPPSDSTMMLTEDQLPLKKNIGRRLEPSVVVSPEAAHEALKPAPRRAPSRGSGERKAPPVAAPAAPAPALPSTPPPSNISNRMVVLVVVIAALSLLVAATAVVLRLRG